MKVESAQRTQEHRHSRLVGRGAHRAMMAGTIVLSWILVFLLTGFWADPRERIREWTVERGALEPMRIREATTTFPRNWARAMRGDPKIPQLLIDLKLPDIQKLDQKRREAIAKSILIQGEDDYVPATIRSGGRSVRVKVRLKGDWTDHLSSEKWSLRVHVRGGDHLFGMRRFSLQHPRVRGYQAEPLFLDALRREGILTPRYSFTRVALNGRSIGLMAIEEHFSKELLESQSRKESVIVAYDESLLWASNDGNLRGFGGTYDNFANATIKVFREGQVSKSVSLDRDADIAIGLLRGFANGSLAASEVFDIETMGRFLAVAEVWGVVHAARWHNLRFYYNPIIARLEPIGFDADAHFLLDPELRLVDKETFVTAVLRDETLRDAYTAAIDRVAQEFLDGTRQEEIATLEREILEILHREFPLIRSYPIRRILERAHALLGTSHGSSNTARSSKTNDYAALIRAYIIETDGVSTLEVFNGVPERTTIDAIRYVDESGGNVSDQYTPLTELPTALDATTLHTLPSPSEFSLDPKALSHGRGVEVVASIQGSRDASIASAIPYRPTLTRNPRPETTLEDALSKHEFLRPVARRADTVEVAAGSWTLEQSLVLRKGVALHVAAGTTLRFPADAALIVQGPVHFLGTEDAPIVLEPASTASWPGVFVSSNQAPSRWSNVIVRSTAGVATGRWQLTGGVTFYRSPIRMVDCLFDGSSAEDALNIVRSDFSLEGVQVQNTASDGLDIDFSNGSIRGGSFDMIGRSTGGDAIDVSGSTVQVSGTTINRTVDKGLSVGEGSEMTAHDVEILGTATGAACKDGSKLEISNALIQQSQVASLMAYTKKPEYGPARIVASDIRTNGTARIVARAQFGNTIRLDGSEIDAEDIDVDELYRTTMRPGRSR